MLLKLIECLLDMNNLSKGILFSWYRFTLKLQTPWLTPNTSQPIKRVSMRTWSKLWDSSEIAVQRLSQVEYSWLLRHTCHGQFHWGSATSTESVLRNLLKYRFLIWLEVSVLVKGRDPPLSHWRLIDLSTILSFFYWKINITRSTIKYICKK